MTLDAPTINTLSPDRPRAVVIGAGIGGLAGAVRLAAAGMHVTVLERHGHLGGKIRTVPSAAGPVDAGPTVLTLRHVFDDLFQAAGARIEDYVTLVPQEILARHFWPDGSQLDLFADRVASLDAIHQFAGSKSAEEFRRFSDRCAHLFDGFDAPMMQAAEPALGELSRHVMSCPNLIAPMAPLSTLAGLLKRQFSDPRLAQLFGRYATYVGGSPYRSPALLALIWQAEAAGVWVVKGGIHRLTEALGEVATGLGAEIETHTHVDRIEVQGGRAMGVRLIGGRWIPADVVLFNGDPQALATGLLGDAARDVAKQTETLPRSHSARVYSFAAEVSGPDIAHHNVFFDADPRSEFDDLAAGQLPSAPTLYLCAEDRGLASSPPDLERFEIIANAPASRDAAGDDSGEVAIWHQMIMQKMARFGVRFSPMPAPSAITTPAIFGEMFPGSNGALYGQTPHGLTAAFQRPTARTSISGLYVAGGGTHPGAGVPMATLSARHAVAAILSDRTSTSPLARTAMRGGMSTA
ncbi:MAG: phytoene desaturase [Rhodobacteraceae bacterium]|nr:phytoene desaturase [Paracoccaceae bacterium]